MFEFFDFLVSIIGIAIDSIVGLVQMLVTVVIQLFQGFLCARIAIEFLPDRLIVLVGVIVSFSIIVNVINKGG